MRLTTSFLLTLDSQQVFDIVAWHLLDQNERATSNDGRCLYRTKDGRRCAIGWIMPDDVYRVSYESMGVCDLASALQDSLRGMVFARFVYRHMPMLASLQALHDAHRPHEWPAGLRVIARCHGLNAAVVERILDEPDVLEDETTATTATVQAWHDVLQPAEAGNVLA